MELIAESVSPKNITFQLEEDAEIIALEWSLDQLKVQEMMQYMVDIGLFECSTNNQITCFKLAKRLDDTNSKNPQIKHIISELDSDMIRQTPTNSEELRLEEIKLEEIKLNKKKTAPKTKTLTTFLSDCEINDVEPIPEGSIVFENAKKIGIDFEMVVTAWSKFKDAYTVDNPNKKYTDWRSVFNKAVKDNWYKLWWTDSDGNVAWTSTGQQARKIYGNN